MRNIQVMAAIVLLLSSVCMGDKITVGKGGWEDFDNIQDAINYSWDGDVVEVQPGTYEENVYFNGRAITLTGTNPDDPFFVSYPTISPSSGYSVIFYFNEDSTSIITGFRISKGIYCLGTSPTISKNIIRNANPGINGSNGASPTINKNIIRNCDRGIRACHGVIEGNTIEYCTWGLYECKGIIVNNIISNNTSYNDGSGLFDCDGIISNNLIIDNTTSTRGGGLFNCDGTINNNIIAGNRANNAGGGLFGCMATISNNIIVGNKGGALSGCSTAIVKNNIIAVNEFWNGGGIYGACQNSYNMFWDNGFNFGGGAYGKTGDIYRNPFFAQDGYWDDNGTPEDKDDDFWVDGDYHLKSEAGRWDPNMNVWVIDNITSPAIDAGDPADSVGDEPQPNGGRINMGAYGGTAEASKTPGTGITLPGIVENFKLQGGHKQISLSWAGPADTGGLPVTAFKIYRGLGIGELVLFKQVGSGIFSLIDTELQNDVDYFYGVSALTDAGEGPRAISHYVANWNVFDFNRDGIVNIIDWALFSKEWLWQADWRW